MTRVVFLCGHNAARSQMAEGFLRSIGGDRFVAESAGTVASELHPLAVRVMLEAGVDISQHRSKSIDELAGRFVKHVAGAEDCGWKGGVVWRIGVVLRLEGQPIPKSIDAALLSDDRAVQKVAGVELHAGLGGRDLQRPPGRRFFDVGRSSQRTRSHTGAI